MPIRSSAFCSRVQNNIHTYQVKRMRTHPFEGEYALFEGGLGRRVPPRTRSEINLVFDTFDIFAGSRINFNDVAF
ncbi:MAG: hypothetical protein ACPIA2_10740, partial [Mariniblastus sp.]